MVRAAQCSGPISLDLSTLSLNPAVTILRQTGNLLEASYTGAKVGRRVEVVFEKLNDDITLPQFRLARASA